jgi:hypothetical protein
MRGRWSRRASFQSVADVLDSTLLAEIASVDPRSLVHRLQ